MNCSKLLFKGLILFPFLLSLSCSESGSKKAQAPNGDLPQEKPNSRTVEGAINGRAWSLAQGRAQIVHRGHRKILMISLWNEVFPAPCMELVGSTLQARIGAAPKVGEGKIDPKDPFRAYPSIIFSDYAAEYRPHQNMIASEGQITIDQIGGDTVRGHITGTFPSAATGRTELSGSFEVPFCGSR